MRLLCLDAGNSKLAVATLEGGRVRERVDLPPGALGGELAAALLATVLPWAGGGLQGVVLASVRPDLDPLLDGILDGAPDLAALPRHRVDHRSPLGFGLEVDEPGTVGADRLCNVAGAVARGHADAIVVDLGTANTYDLLRGGRFEGGLIGAGVGLAHRALVGAGARLPEVPLARPATTAGRDTTAAMQAGSWWQGVGGVASVVARLRAEHGELPLFLTGGLAELVGPDLPGAPLLLPQLTLEGAASIGQRAFAHD